MRLLTPAQKKQGNTPLAEVLNNTAPDLSDNEVMRCFMEMPDEHLAAKIQSRVTMPAKENAQSEHTPTESDVASVFSRRSKKSHKSRIGSKDKQPADTGSTMQTLANIRDPLQNQYEPISEAESLTSSHKQNKCKKM